MCCHLLMLLLLLLLRLLLLLMMMVMLLMLFDEWHTTTHSRYESFCLFARQTAGGAREESLMY